MIDEQEAQEMLEIFNFIIRICIIVIIAVIAGAYFLSYPAKSEMLFPIENMSYIDMSNVFYHFEYNQCNILDCYTSWESRL